MKKNILTIVLVVLLPVLFFYAGKGLLSKSEFYHNENSRLSDEGERKSVDSAIFICADNKVIDATFFIDRVELLLSDKREVVLPEVAAASGAKYANEDESLVFWNKGNDALFDEGGVTTFKECSQSFKKSTLPVAVANPASENCVKQGGKTVTDKRGDGGEYGLCYFEENRACEEWALMRGECPVGGRKTTGYDTIDQKYCAWSGGTTYAVKNATCTFKNGKVCSTIDFYNGKCTQTK